ncbi:hypothetical protein AMK16_14450 [Streptomyces sp. CB00455]|uniref:hypothetical protein n=1 Tax=Streptomyces sp. CB00455 TaxID=1703927 RepID=UPI00093CDEAA|nr:hypothetical protein [Streptomyces sp. CB00455]OKK19327.1 hypothetical protein AMK16_14450 [Streptomyces sp. CB00455]
MGGRKDTRRGRQARPGLLRAVLLTALAVAAGVLLLCARPGEPHAPSGFPAYGAATAVAAHGTAPGRSPGQAPGPARGRTPGQAPGPAHAVCVSPYDLPGCSPLAHVIPGVLPAPPPAATTAGGSAPPAAASGAAGGTGPPGPLARAPDLHVLQVLRT